MSTRDLGRHIVELHEHGMFAITGEGTRITLTAHEALDMLKWLNQHQSILQNAIKMHEENEGVEILQEEVALASKDPSERDAPIDEE